MNAITNWMKEYAEVQNFQPDVITAMKGMNYLMAINAIVVGLLLLGPGELFLQPVSPPDEFWLDPNWLGVGVWEVAFIIGGVILAVCTTVLRGIKAMHGVMAFSWGTFALVWTIGGILNSPSYLFGVGIFGIFIALQHIAMAGIWRSEGV